LLISVFGSDLLKPEKKRLDKALKVLANATSYGIYGEMIREESDREKLVTCYGIDAESFQCRVAHADKPGEYCFPPFASLITGAARLMLALLEHSVTELGGTYAMEDTDSMAIVATKTGGLIPCPGGPLRVGKEREAIKALSWKQVQEISKRFANLNCYDRSAIPGSILKIEEDNFDPITKEQRQIYCMAISAKRYLLFLRENGKPVLLRASCPACGRKNKPGAVQCANLDCGKPVQPNNETDRWSQHGLGHLLNPTDPESSNRDWIEQVWLNLTRKALGTKSGTIEYSTVPAVSRVSISSPALMRPLAKLNENKKYADQIKPFNFILTCHVNPFGHPPGADPDRFHLIAAYETNPTLWLESDWIEQYSGKRYRISTTEDYGTENIARVKSYAEVLLEYEFHPEAKCADANGNACEKQSIGLLQRRRIRISGIKYIGKESNLLEDVESGLIHSPEAVYTEYVDQRRDEWETQIRPALKKISLSKLVELTGMSRSQIKELRAGRSRPHPENQKMLCEIVQKVNVTSASFLDFPKGSGHPAGLSSDCEFKYCLET
jgi:hypothetical protein